VELIVLLLPFIGYIKLCILANSDQDSRCFIPTIPTVRDHVNLPRAAIHGYVDFGARQFFHIWIPKISVMSIAFPTAGSCVMSPSVPVTSDFGIPPQLVVWQINSRFCELMAPFLVRSSIVGVTFGDLGWVQKFCRYDDDR